MSSPAKRNQSLTSLPVLTGLSDRFCVWCGDVIRAQNIEKSVCCGNARCRRAVPLRGQNWSVPGGWGHCLRCDYFTHKAHHYCMLCGAINNDQYMKRIESKGTKLREKQKILEEKLEEKDEIIENMTFEIADLRAQVQSAASSRAWEIIQQGSNPTEPYVCEAEWKLGIGYFY